MNFKNFEKEIYLKALIDVAQADGNISDKERIFIESQADILEVDIVSFGEINNGWIISKTDNQKMSYTTKMSILMDLITIGYMDGEYDENEKMKVRKVAKIFNVTLKKVTELENWLLKYWKILETGKKLLGFNLNQCIESTIL
jgi:uncharacterized tellurite resistance protein B-like protein